MELLGAIGNRLAFTGGLQDSLKQEADRDKIVQPLGDTLSISEEAKERLQLQRAEKTENQARDDASGAASGSGAGTTVAGAGETSDESNDRIAQLKRQIKEVQKRLKEANERLREAQAEQAASKSKDPEDAESAGTGEDSPEVKSARLEVDQLNQQLMKLNEELRKAMGLGKGSGGLAGGGYIGGTRANSGVGAVTGHIGDATDPYAAAAAAISG